MRRLSPRADGPPGCDLGHQKLLVLSPFSPSRLLGGEAFAQRPEMRGLKLLLIARVQYLIVRARLIRTFGGVDITSDAGWAELKASIRATALAMVR